MDENEFDLYKKIALLEVQNTELKAQLSDLKVGADSHLTNEIYEKAKRRLYTSIGGILLVFTLFGVISINQIVEEIKKKILEDGTSKVVEKVAERIQLKIEGNITTLVKNSIDIKIQENLTAFVENIEQSKPKSSPDANQSTRYVEAIEKLYEGNKYWVIAASSLSRAEVEGELEKVKNKMGRETFEKEFPNAEITAPYPGTNHYPLVLGMALPYKEANSIRLKAIKYGFRKDTFLWKDK